MYEGGNGGMYPGSNGGVSPTTPVTPVNALTVDYWFKQHWKLIVLIVFLIVVLGQTIFQIVYPSSRLIPGTYVDGVDVGGMKYADAAKKLDGEYGNLKLDIFFGKNGAAFQSPKMSEVGIGVDNTERLNAITYPVYLRFIPGSIWWAPLLAKPGDIAYVYDKTKIADYTLSKVGSDCSIPPKNASLKLIETQLQLVPSISGGQCDINDFQQTLAKVKPTSDEQNKVRIAINEQSAPISDDMARDLAAKLNSRLATPMPITVDVSTAKIPGRVVLSWLDFKADVPQQTIDNSGNQQASLKFSVNQKRMEEYLNQDIAAQLIKKPGVTKVSTTDFTETSRVNGANGRGLDAPKIAQSVVDYINNKTQQAIGATVVIGPTVEYTRKYTPTSVGFSALLAQFAQDNPGNYSLAFNELGSVEFPRSAVYRGDAPMPAAGIHSLYIGLADVMQQYANVLRPVDIVSGNNDNETCFKLMFQQFDKGCRTGLYDAIGYAALTSIGKNAGLRNTVFAGENTTTSVSDVHNLMINLYKNKVARVEGGQNILSALRSIRENDGIPAGSGTDVRVAHVTGEADGVFNDSAVIYNSTYGVYALTVLSNGDGTSWDKLSKLAKDVLMLKSQKIPKGAR
ncbi:MAG: beta-lactamase class [Patescibacteria group bacterium]|nr:beta-lactamase class [Patescibacteria group bacterium]